MIWQPFFKEKSLYTKKNILKNYIKKKKESSTEEIKDKRRKDRNKEEDTDEKCNLHIKMQ